MAFPGMGVDANDQMTLKASALTGSARIRFSFGTLSYQSIFADIFLAESSRFLFMDRTQPGELHFLARMLYQLSNSFVMLGGPDDCIQLLRFILHPTRKPMLNELFSIEHLTVKAVWQQLIRYARFGSDRESFRYLVQLGLRMPTLDHVDIHSCYRGAHQLECYDIMEEILSGDSGYKLGRYLLQWEQPFHLRESMVLVRLFLDGVLRLGRDADASKMLLRFIEAGDWFHDMIELDHQRRFLDLLLRHGGLHSELEIYTQVLDKAAYLAPRHYDAIAGNISLGEPSLEKAMESAREGTAALEGYLAKRLFVCKEQHQSFLSMLLHQLLDSPMPLLEAVEAALCMGANPSLAGSWHGYQHQQSPLLKTVERAATASRTMTKDERNHFHQLIAALIKGSRAVTGDVIAASVSTNGDTSTLKHLISCCGRQNAAVLGERAVVKAAHFDNFDAVLILHESGLDCSRPNHCSRLWGSDVFASAIAGDDDYYGGSSAEMTRFLLDRIALPDGSAPLDAMVSALKEVIESRQVNRRQEKCEILEEYGLDLTQHLPHLDAGLALMWSSGCVYWKMDEEAEQLFWYLTKRGARLTGSVLSSLIRRDADYRLIQAVLDAKPDPNPVQQSDPEMSAFQAATAHGSLDLVKTLVGLGAHINPDPHRGWGQTPLQAACGRAASAETLSIISYLIEQGADVNAPVPDYGGATALQAAAGSGNIEAAMLLLQHGAEPNARSIEGFALDLAASEGRLDIVQLLLMEGAVSFMPGKTGYDGAIRRAERTGHGAVATLIRRHATSCQGEEAYLKRGALDGIRVDVSF